VRIAALAGTIQAPLHLKPVPVIPRLHPIRRKGSAMKSVAMVGVLLLLLGLLCFVVPIPHRESHGVQIGDTKIGIQTESREKLPPAVGIVLLAGGVLALVVGLRKT
jgi:uncharacterized membrane protein HdeD (DUF308 family)